KRTFTPISPCRSTLADRSSLPFQWAICCHSKPSGGAVFHSSGGKLVKCMRAAINPGRFDIPPLPAKLSPTLRGTEPCAGRTHLGERAACRDNSTVEEG